MRPLLHAADDGKAIPGRHHAVGPIQAFVALMVDVGAKEGFA